MIFNSDFRIESSFTIQKLPKNYICQCVCVHIVRKNYMCVCVGGGGRGSGVLQLFALRNFTVRKEKYLYYSTMWALYNRPYISLMVIAMVIHWYNLYHLLILSIKIGENKMPMGICSPNHPLHTRTFEKAPTIIATFLLAQEWLSNGPGPPTNSIIFPQTTFFLVIFPFG